MGGDLFGDFTEIMRQKVPWTSLAWERENSDFSNLDRPGRLDMAVGLGEGNSDLKPGWAGKFGHGRGPWGR